PNKPMGGPLRHTADVQWAAFSPDGQFVVTAGYDRKASVWRLEKEQQTAIRVATFEHDQPVSQAGFSSTDGRLVVTASKDGLVRIWDRASREPVAILGNPGRGLGAALQPNDRSEEVRSAAFHPDGEHVVTLHRGAASSTAQVRIWTVSPLP